MIDHDADVDIDDLVEAKINLDRAVAVAGDHGALTNAQHGTQWTLDAIVDSESFEDKLREAKPVARLAEDCLAEYRRYLSRQYRKGRVRLANAEYLFLDARLTDAADALSRWIDYAEHELRQIAA